MKAKKKAKVNAILADGGKGKSKGKGKGGAKGKGGKGRGKGTNSVQCKYCLGHHANPGYDLCWHNPKAENVPDFFKAMSKEDFEAMKAKRTKEE